jgi:hypothetical protein
MSATALFPSGLPETRTVREIVSTFLKISEGVALRWYDTRKGVMLLVNVPYQPASGAIYIYDRQRDLWYMLNFESIDSTFTAELFVHAYKEYKLLNYVIQPGLLLNLLSISDKTPEDSHELLCQLEEFPAHTGMLFDPVAEAQGA